MTLSDTELLRQFTKDRSESAFEALVGRHLDLVYTAALRQVDGNPTAAEEVTQEVFADLARRAGRLGGHTSLTGWLYTSTRYVAANSRRTELRRRAREQEAYTMNQLLHGDGNGDELDWNKLRPVLDEAMHELRPMDREVVLLRYFERHPLSEVGIRTGLSENTARMRVDRAVEKLRRILARRGVTSSAAALTMILAGQAVAQAPASLLSRVSRSSISAAAAAGTTGGLLSFLILVMTRTQAKMLIGAALLAVVVTTVTWPRFHSRPETVIPSPTTLAAEAPPGQTPRSTPAPVRPKPASAMSEPVTADPSATLQFLHLTFVTADTERPLSDVTVESRAVASGKSQKKKTLTAADGTTIVQFPTNIADLDITATATGYADTKLGWTPKKGEVIPPLYTVKMERAPIIGGTVLTPDGKPIAGAKVGFNQEETPGMSRRPENHEFGWIEVETDATGKWHIDRIAEDVVRRIFGNASHPDYVSSPTVFVQRDPAVEKALRNGTHIFQLGRGINVTGIVVDSAGSPIAEAQVAVGHIGEGGRRTSVSATDGKFVVRGNKTGPNLLTAQAKGFAATTQSIEVTENGPGHRLVLRPAVGLRLKVVNRKNEPIAGANVWLNTFGDPMQSIGLQTNPPVQAEVELKTDAEGRAFWEDAPDAELIFDFSAKGYMDSREIKLHPDATEKVIPLDPALTIFGKVTDANTGAAVPKFKIITGWPSPNYSSGTTNPAWSTLDRFWLNFANGEYRHTYEEPVISGYPEISYMFKFEADDYTTFVSRVVRAEEGEVQLDVSLRPAKDKSISVLTPDGRPAANATVALIESGGAIQLQGVTFDPNGHRGSTLAQTDSRGHFRLPSNDQLIRIAVSHPEGFVQTSPQQLAEETPLRLEAWGQLEGTWRAGDKPAAGRYLLLETPQGFKDTVQLGFNDYHLQTDAEGKFHYDHVPSGNFKLVRLIRQDQGAGQTSWAHARKTDVEIHAGESTHIDIGGEGYQLTLRLAWPGGQMPPPPVNIWGSVHTPFVVPPAAIQGNPTALAAWRRSPEIQRLVAAIKNFPFMTQPDGTLSVEDVEPGTYDLQTGAVVPGPDGQPQSQFMAPPQKITIPSDPPTGVIDLGTIPLQLAPALKQ